jgi:hypothetical protein
MVEEGHRHKLYRVGAPAAIEVRMLAKYRLIRAAGLAGLLAAGGCAPALAIVGREDSAEVSRLLEEERTGVARVLPSGSTFVITGTQTRPEVCRSYTISREGAEPVAGRGCRTGPATWTLEDGTEAVAAGAPEAEAESTPTPAATPAAAAAPPLPPQRPGAPAPTAAFIPPLPPQKPASL